MSAGSYIGKSPQYGFFEKQKITTANGVLTSFALNFTTADSAQLLVSVGGVIQETGTAYTVDSSTPQNIVFTGAPATGIEIFIVWLGKQTTGPTFSSAMLTDKTALGTAPASVDTFLIYDEDAGVLKKVAYSNVHSGVADMAANTVKVRDAATTGTPSDKTVANTEILIGDGTGFTAAALSGDITMTNAGVTAIGADKVVTTSILDDNVTYDKMQDTATNNRVLGAVTAGTVGEVQVATGMIADNAVDLTKLSDGTQGGTLYYGASGAPTELAAGTSGKFLKTLGAGVDPAWDDVPPGAPTGGGTDKIFFENEMTVDTDYTITANNNAMSAGTVTVVSGITVTLLGTSSWIIV
jgi:hypothetical protein